jgi:hypothetical protein
MVPARYVLIALASVVLLTQCKSKEEILKAAEEKGEIMVEKQARLVKGIGQGLQNEGKTAGEQLAKGSAEVLRGVESGAVDGFSSMPISVSESLSGAGIKAERAALHREDPKSPQVKVYLVLDKPYKGDVTLLARSKDGKEVGRSKVAVDEPETGKYVLFPFDPLVDLSIAASLELR